MVYTTQDAVALAAKLCNVEALPYHPTIHSSVAEKLETYLGKTYSCNIMKMESHESVLPCAIGSMLGGKRTLVATSSAFNFDDISRISYMRLPLTLVNFSRIPGIITALSNTEIFMSYRNSSWLMFSPESIQEIVDMIIQSYAIGEKAGLPSIVNIDNPSLIQNADMPSDKMVDNIIGKSRIGFNPESKDFAAIGAPLDSGYSHLAQQQQKAVETSAKNIQKLEETWKKFKRPAGMVENFMLEDAEYVIITYGMNSGTVKSAITRMRQAGEKVGLLRLRTLRPFPSEEIMTLSAKHLAVIEYNPSSHLATDISSISNLPCSSFISAEGLVREKDISEIVKRLKAGKEERVWI